MKLAFLLFFVIALTSIVNGHQYGVRLQDTPELTFRKDIWTKNVKEPSTTQLVFIGGNARRNVSQMKFVKCLNTGNDWDCTVNNLDPVLNFTKVAINCEGANYADDEYILPESCYLEYELNYMPVVQLGNMTKSTRPVNTSNDTDMCCDLDYDLSFWPFNELSDDPDTQKVMLFSSIVSFVVVMFTFNCCNCNNKKRYVVDNAEEASESDSSENEELKM